MSNHHSYYCLDCTKCTTPAELNWGAEQMVAVLKHKRALVALVPFSREPKVYDFYINISSGHTVPLEFLAEHLEHKIVIMSEYKDHYFNEEGVETTLREGFK